MKPRVLFVARSRYRLPLSPSLRRKWDALADELDFRVLASGADQGASNGVFRLVPPARVRALDGVAFYGSLPSRVASELRRFDPEVVVAQSPYEAACALLAIAATRSRARLLLEVHGDWSTAGRFYGSRARLAISPLADRLAHLVVRRANAVRTVSPFTSGLVRRLDVEPAAVFTTFFDSTAFDAPPAPLPDEPRALFVGVLERYKNVAGLAAAWPDVARRVPGARLQVIGRGRDTATVEQLVGDLPGQVSWTSAVPPDEVAAALDDACVLVLPSFSEGLPRVAMEAFYRARPVVASRAGGIPDIVVDGENGLLVPPGDSGALADALVRVLTDRALLERLAAGAAVSSARWRQSPEGFAARMRAVVDETIAAP
ncbi:MAG TPA: glycosyltransferase family 4 protein [Gaiellaceae bacterium]